MLEQLKTFFSGKSVLILGFGKEGRSTLSLLQRLGSAAHICVADQAEIEEQLGCDTVFGANYLDCIDDYDIVMKSPGIALFDRLKYPERITSQTDLLLRFCDNKIVGITGTKGKSTTSSLIYHILRECGKDALLIGNIGVPPLERLDEFSPSTILVCEMSCHQLEYVSASPDIAVLLNIFEEHLDHYVDFAAYRRAKLNIARYQKNDDVLIYDVAIDSDEISHSKASKITSSLTDNADIFLDGDLLITPYGEFSQLQTALIGRHNLYNIGIALTAAVRCGCDIDEAVAAVGSFRGLPHRLESIGIFDGIEYVNDSISTIPNAAISALLAMPDTDTLIVGGMERGISYQPLVQFLRDCGLKQLIVLPDCGYRIQQEITASYTPNFSIYRAKDLEDAVRYAHNVTKTRCILSPAAASYGFYRNFEERGEHFRQLVNRINIL